MMKTYQMMGVDQSAARYIATQHDRRHTCEQLGICQCEGLAFHPGHVCERKAEDAPTPSPIERISYWCAVVLLSVASAVVFSGATVYLYSL